MDKNGLEFLNKIYSDLHLSNEVMHRVSKSDTPIEKIDKFDLRLQR